MAIGASQLSRHRDGSTLVRPWLAIHLGLRISRDGQNRAMSETRYAGRSAADPDWQEAQIARAMERERQRRAQDRATGRPREPEAASGLTFDELWLRVGGDRGSLWAVLRNEVRRGRIDYHSTTRRYVLSGGVDPALRQALLRVGHADDRP